MNRSASSGENQSGKRRVTVLAEPAPPVTQSDQFRLCPLGLQLELNAPVELFTVMEANIESDGTDGRTIRASLTGTVVECRFDPRFNRYRVWLQFLEVPEPIRSQLKCTARGNGLLCPYCQNF